MTIPYLVMQVDSFHSDVAGELLANQQVSLMPFIWLIAVFALWYLVFFWWPRKKRQPYTKMRQLQRRDKLVQIKAHLLAPMKSLKKLIIKENIGERQFRKNGKESERTIGNLKLKKSIELVERYIAKEHPRDPMTALLGRAESTKPVYRPAPGGGILRENYMHIDTKIVSVAACLKGGTVKGGDVDDHNRKAMEAIKHYASLWKVQAFFLLPYYARRRVILQEGRQIEPSELCRVYAGVENLLLEIYEELPEGGHITDEVVERKIDSLFKSIENECESTTNTSLSTISEKKQFNNSEETQKEIEQVQKQTEVNQPDIYEILMDAICCVMCADKKVTTRERKAIHTILEKVKAPWDQGQIDGRINDFIQRVNKEDLKNLIQQTCDKLPEFKRRKKEQVLLKCIDYMARADGVVHEKEIELIDKFKSVLGTESDDSGNQVSSVDTTTSRQKGKTEEEKEIKVDSDLPDNTETNESSEPSMPHESADDRIDSLWERAQKLGSSDADYEKKISIYTEVLDLVEKDSHEASATFWNRGLCYYGLNNYDAAIADFTRKLEICKRRGEPTILCSDLLQECRGLKRKAEAEAEDDTKSKKMREMVKLERKLGQTFEVHPGPEFEAAFEKLFSYLRDENPDIRDEASRMLAGNTHGWGKLVSIYEDCLNTDPRKSVLAGRVLGRKIDGGKKEMIHAQTAMMYGIKVAFTPCVCGHCSKLNVGIPVPERGLYIGFYGQTDDKRGAYALPVLCDYCGKEFFIAWDSDPR